MKKEKNKMGNIQRAALIRTLIPMVIMGIIIIISSVKLFQKQIEKDVSSSLSTASKMVMSMYDLQYPGEYELQGDDEAVSLYKGDTEITNEDEILEIMKANTGYEYTLFYLNTRIITTLKDAQGTSYRATGLNTAAFNKVNKTLETVFYTVDINGVEYYACYEPVLNKNGEMVCIVGVAVMHDVISNNSKDAVVTIIAISIVCMILATIFINVYTGAIIESIKKIDRFLNGMIKGELSNEMPSDVLQRKDELGSAAKSVVEMQNAIRILVEKDPLTGIYNRRSGNARLKKIISQAEISGMPFSVVLGDIDFFKKVNDTYGHEAGDIVLKKVCEIMKKYMVGKGFVARWGGEEFLLIFSKTDVKETAEIMEEVLDTIRNTTIEYNNMVIKVTMTFGVVRGDAQTEFAELLKKADDRLYYGKTNGRNRIITSDEESSVVTSEENNKKKDETVNECKEINKAVNEEINEKTKNEYIEKEINNIIDDAFLEQLIEKMNEKLYNETLGDNKK